VLPQPVTAELVVVDARDFDVDIDAIEQGARDALLIFGDRGAGAGAGFLAVTIIATGTGLLAIAQFFHAE
jgi:hypothetical protein